MSSKSVAITLKCAAPALFVTLTTEANGRFSDNAFFMSNSSTVTVDFLPFGDLNLTLLEASLRVEDLSLYLTSDDDGRRSRNAGAIN